MKRSVFTVLGVVSLLLTSATVAAAQTGAPSPKQESGSQRFVADFTSPDDLYLFDWQVFHGGIDPLRRGDQPSQWHGDHDMDCGAPTTLRPVQLIGETEPGPPETAGDLIWWCGSRPDAPASSGHVMTSTSLVAYGHIDFSPRQVFDNVSRVCWDQNWTEMGGRKWTQVVVVSEDVFQANGGRMEYVEIGLQDDVAVNGLPVTGDTWMLNLKRASTRVQVGQDETYINDYGFVTDDKSYRFKHCAIDQGNGTVRLELERPNRTEVRIAPGSFPTGPARVIFQDVTYDSVKGDLSFNQAQQTNTWHWDNIEISAGGTRPSGAPVTPPSSPSAGVTPRSTTPSAAPADGGPRLLETRPGASTGDGVAAGIGARDAGSVFELQVAGRAGVPLGTDAVALNLTAVDAAGWGYVTAWPCGQPPPNASNLNYTGPDPIAGSTIVRLSDEGTVCLLTAESSTHLIADVTGWFGDGSGFRARSGARLLDSRPGATTVDGVGELAGLPTPETTYEIQVAGRAGIPSGATAVALTLTATDARGAGYATAWPCGEPRPVASNLNYVAGDTVANSAVITIGDGGRVCIATVQEPTHLVVDTTGWFSRRASYETRAGARLLDTRPGSPTIDGADSGTGLVGAGSVYELQVTGRAGVPDDATAVALNLTSTDAGGWGYVTAWPCGEPRPNASSLNHTGAKAMTNLTLVGVGTGGRVCILAAEQPAHLIADVNGWFRPSAGFTPVASAQTGQSATATATTSTTAGATTTVTAAGGQFATTGLRAKRWASSVSQRDPIDDGYCGPTPTAA